MLQGQSVRFILISSVGSKHNWCLVAFERPGNNSSKARILLFPALLLWNSVAEGSSACSILVFICSVTKGIRGKLKLCVFWAACDWQAWDDIRTWKESLNWHGTEGVSFWSLLLSFPHRNFISLKLQCASAVLLSGRVLLQGEGLKLLCVFQFIWINSSSFQFGQDVLLNGCE